MAGGRSRGLRTQSRASSGRSPLHPRCTHGDAPTAVRPGVRTHSLPSVAGRPGDLWPTTRRASRSVWRNESGGQATLAQLITIRYERAAADRGAGALMAGRLCSPRARFAVRRCRTSVCRPTRSLRGRKVRRLVANATIATFRRYSTFSTGGPSRGLVSCPGDHLILTNAQTTMRLSVSRPTRSLRTRSQIASLGRKSGVQI